LEFIILPLYLLLLQHDSDYYEIVTNPKTESVSESPGIILAGIFFCIIIPSLSYLYCHFNAGVFITLTVFGIDFEISSSKMFYRKKRETMKTIKYTTAVMMVLMIGAAALQAQTTRRSPTHKEKEQVTPTRPTQRATAQKQAVKPRTIENNQQASRVQAQPERKPQVQMHQQASRVQAQPERKPQVQTRQPTVRPERTPVSISTPNNPQSTYRKPDPRVHVTPARDPGARVNKYATERYFGGNYYHYAYPTSRVHLHYDYDTYRNHYHVLYYPTYSQIYWTRSMYRDYRNWYPRYEWRYQYGYRIQTLSIFEAKYNLGEVAMVYGRVYATWYNKETDDLLLFFGGEYPYQEFTVVLPAHIARKFSWRPEQFFPGAHITVTGLITTYDGIPEIVVKNKRQIGLY
jgi:hypothetical protein